jgi:hypothetical protein
MATNPNYHDIQGAVDLLLAGARLFVIENRPYPEPHQVLVVQDDELYPISYNDFAVLLSNHVIQSIGQTTFGGFPAEGYIISREQASRE